MAITYALLGKNGSGNLGNNLFEIASTFGISKKYNTQFILPQDQWKYENDFPNLKEFYRSNLNPQVTIKESNFHFDLSNIDNSELDFQNNYGKKLFDSCFVNIKGWYQSSKYWNDYKEEVKDLFQFSNQVISACKVMKDEFIKNDKQTIAISVRRGDYVGNPNYELLDQKYYIQSLLEYFPNYYDYNLAIFSDDVEWCKIHFSGFENCVYFNCSPIHQLCLMSMCDHAIIANSTFSFWGAYLLQSEHSIIVRPAYHFAGKLLQQNDWKDYYPEDWKIYDHKDIFKNQKKYDLTDVTFTVPVNHDSKDRKQNLELNICMLQKSFDTNIIIGEQGGRSFEYFNQWCKYINFDLDVFHRTKMLNIMCKESNTDIVVNYDADIFLSDSQIIEAVRLIKQGLAEIVYPYNGKFARVQRDPYFKLLESNLDLGDTFKGIEFKGALKDSKLSTGGAVFYDKDSFVEAGMENEYMINYAPEDTERYYRFNTLGLVVKRIDGQLFHLDHVITHNSSTKHEHFKENNNEFYGKIDQMNQNQLQEYVDSWPWLQEYNLKYYETITKGAIKSRDEVLYQLDIKYRELSKRKEEENDFGISILDVGCGLGEWGHQIKENFDVKEYIGLDFRIPKENLLIPQEDFINHNLKRKFDLERRFDLVICLEVAEHLKEKYAEQLIECLTNHSDKVLFSAAIPYQGGLNHYNEQWQNYWVKLFNKFNFKARNIRHKLYSEDIELWYRQNMVLYEKTKEPIIDINLDFIHPEMYIRVINSIKEK